MLILYPNARKLGRSLFGVLVEGSAADIKCNVDTGLV
jgi:hypothetical protein